MKFRQKARVQARSIERVNLMFGKKKRLPQRTQILISVQKTLEKVFEINVHASCYFQRTFQLLPCVARSRKNPKSKLCLKIIL